MKIVDLNEGQSLSKSPTKEESNAKVNQAGSSEIPAAHKELLEKALPENVKKGLGVEKLLSEAAKMSSEDYSRMVPIENLPSLYKLYSEKIYGRPLKVVELKKLSNINEGNMSSCMSDILKSCLKGINHDDIAVGDKLYLILWLRANTYPQSGYSVPCMCNQCEAESTYNFKIDDVEMKTIRTDADISGPVEMSNGDQIGFKYITIGDEQRVQKFKASMRSSLSKFDDDTLTLASAVISINGEKKSLMEVHDYLHSSPEIYSRVLGHLNEFDFGIKSVMNVICEECGGTTPVGISFRSDFFIPKYSAK
jgi:hypothetical protein